MYVMIDRMGCTLMCRPFVLLVFMTVLLMALVGGSIMLLSSVGETKLPSTLTLAIGGSMKRD